MPRESTKVGSVKLRQQYTRKGRPQLYVSIPYAVAEYLGWKPGGYVDYFPTMDKALVLLSQEDTMIAIGSKLRFDPAAVRDTIEPWNAPRPNSMYEKEVLNDHRMEQLLEKLRDMKTTRKSLIKQKMVELGVEEDDVAEVEEEIEHIKETRRKKRGGRDRDDEREADAEDEEVRTGNRNLDDKVRGAQALLRKKKARAGR